MTRRLISVVLPVYNEEQNIGPLVERIVALFTELPYTVEVIIVNDGSDAPTTLAIEAACRRFPEVGAVHLSRNFGHQAALTAGLNEAQGDAVVSMDSDFQHPVELLPTMIRHWEEGIDVVYTVREDEPGQSPFKRWTSRGFYRVLNWMSDVEVPPSAADFRLLDRSAVDALRALPERTRFLRALSVWIGFRQIAVPFKPSVRRAGRTKYNARRMLRLALDGLVSTSTRPLKLFLLIGAMIAGLSFVYLAYVVLAFFFSHRAIKGWSSLIVAMLFLGGLQIMLLGVLGLYVGKIYDETKGRPLYLVRRRTGRSAA